MEEGSKLNGLIYTKFVVVLSKKKELFININNNSI